MMHSCDRSWLVKGLVLMILVVYVSADDVIVQNNLVGNQVQNEIAYVTQHTRVNRRKRSDAAAEDAGSGSQLFDFANKMSFIIQAKGQLLVVNLTRSSFARTEVKLADENGEIKHDYLSRVGVYHGEKNGASLLVECREEDQCTLQGTFDIKGEKYDINPDHSTDDIKFHTIHKRAVPTLEDLSKFLRIIPVDKETRALPNMEGQGKSLSTLPDEMDSAVSQGIVRKRRSLEDEPGIPDCDIIEVKALADNTVYEFYKDKFGGDEHRAEEELTKYFFSIFAEVDFRYKCLTYYFENYEGTCGIKCLRVILVELAIDKTNSFTEGTYKTQKFPDGTVSTFTKGGDALRKLSESHRKVPDAKKRWDYLIGFTRHNIIFQEHGNYFDYFRVISWRPGMCEDDVLCRTAIVEAKGDGVSISIGHGILHALFAYNDEEQNCNKNAYFLMREHYSKKTKNPAFWGQNWYITDCTVKSICQYVTQLNKNNKNCMRERVAFDEAEWHEWVKTPLPGELFSADHQCKDKWGNDSVQCDPTGQGDFFPKFMCSRFIWCTLNGSCVCQVKVSSGTPCGKAKVCTKGSCKPKPDVPLGGTCDCHSQCAGDNAVCDPCTCTCVCVDGFFDDNGKDVEGGNCTEKKPVNGPCRDDRECRDPNAECIDRKCVCRPCYYKRHGRCFEQSCLGDTCNKTKECKGDNVVCDLARHICVCQEGYFVNDEGKCVKVNGTLCDPCIQDPDSCTQAHTECTDKGICECVNGKVAVDGECYGTRVGEKCTHVVNTCTDDCAECNGTICDCKHGFVWNGTHCVGSDLCDQCDPSTLACDYSLVCSPHTYRCECPTNYVQIGDTCYGTRVTEPCTTQLDTCVDDRACCNGTICDCIHPYSWNGTRCVGTDLCDPCDPSSNTCRDHLVCSSHTYRCECPPDHVQLGDNCYGTRVSELCTTTLDTCVDCFAECNGTVCDCISGFTWNGSRCVGHDLCDPCDPNLTSCTYGLECNPHTYRCECPSDQVQISDMCYGTRVTEPCTSNLDTCVDKNADCNGTTCECITGFIWNGSICVGPDPCDPCDTDTPSCGHGLVCSPHTHICECPSHQVQIGDTCYGTRVTEECTDTLDTCTDKYAECNGTVCVCKHGFIWNDTKCVGSELCDPCDESTPSCRSDLVCNPHTYRCECPTNEVQIGDHCYGTRVYELCTPSLSTCVDQHAECDGKICDCVPGFTWNGSRCVGYDLCDPCDPFLNSCCSTLVCSQHTYRCECPEEYVQIGDKCYGTRVNDPCTSSLDTCIDNNAVCNGTHCDCEAGFIWNGSICVGPNPCDPCDPHTPSCEHGLACSTETYRCECPSHQVLIGKFCYGTRVTEECTTELNTCVDDCAGCNGTVCDCLHGYTWNGTRCVGSEICDPCDSMDDTCHPPLVCNPSTSTCECPLHQVQIGNHCYGTRVTEECTPALPTCIDDCAMCNGTNCDCKAEYVWNGTVCVGKFLCDTCDPFTPTCSFGLVCNPHTHRCECPPDEVQIGRFCYGTRVFDQCTLQLDTCTDNHAECNGKLCDCISGFTWNGSRCVGEALCDPCDPLNPTCEHGLVCSPHTCRCECPEDQVQYGDTCYGTHVTEPCTQELNTCVDDCAMCNGTICDCKAGYIWNGSICVGSYLCDSCDPETLACGYHLVCSPHTNRCECPSNYVQIGHACYGTRVNENCSPHLPTCVDDNAECYGGFCQCRYGFKWNGSLCVGKELCDPCDPSFHSCGHGLVCSPHTYRCECPTDHVQIADGCFGTHVTDDCTSEVDTCVDKNAECNGTTCDCIHGFIWNGSKCVGQELCDPCDPLTPSCAHDLECSPHTYRCECPTNHVQIADQCYGTRVTEVCTPVLDTCVDKYADCNGTICDCVPGFSWNGSICVGTDLCDPCDVASSTCAHPFVCSSDTCRCECPAGHVQIGNHCYGTRVTEGCTSSPDTCIDDNAKCNGTICDCIHGFIWTGHICVGPDLCDPCDPSVQSCADELVCSESTHRCECPSDEVQIGDNCFGTRVTEPCTANLSTCIDYFAECNGTVCDCVSGFIWNGTRCVGHDLCDQCDPSILSCEPHLVCSPDTYRCECPPDQVQLGNECLGRLVTETCNSSRDTCIDNNAECNDTVCDCLPGFTWTGTICVGTNICEPCSPEIPCSGHLVCLNSSVCGCPDHLVQIGDTCYGRLVTEPCTHDLDTCIDNFAVCNGTTCDCMEGYFWNGSICGGQHLCDPCDPSSNTCNPHLVCSPHTYRCECPIHEVQVGDSCVGTRVTEECLPIIDTCVDYFAECNGTICDCIPGFVWNGSKCVGHDLCDPCDPSIPSCEDHLVCSPHTYRCECPSDRVQIGNGCFGTRVTEPCSVPDTCIDCFAECNGTVCDCSPGYFWNGSICVGKDLCDPCDPSSSTCHLSLVCSSETFRCECPPHKVQIGDHCYGTRVTESCLPTLDTCIDKNADCNGTVCDCEHGFTWNGSICVGHYLCDPCDPSVHSCRDDLVCNPHTYRCECPPDEVQYKDECYGTRVFDDCTPMLDTCIDDNAICNGKRCECMEGYTCIGSRCVGSCLCDPCDPWDSTCADPLVCSAHTERCECPSNQVQIGDHCYGTLVTEECTHDVDTCVDDYAMCNGTVCDCISGFRWNGSRCVGHALCDPCDPSINSCEDDLECSPHTYRCECPTHQVQSGDTCYGTRVTEPCTPDLDTCTDNNAMCNGTICDCVPEFIWNGTYCVGPDLCDPCDPSTPSCRHGFICSSHSYRCECPSNEVQVGDRCYGTLVTESCTPILDTCIDDFAGCNGTVCDCMHGSIWNGSKCVGNDLCSPCDPNSPSCESPLECNPDTYRCECPHGQVQIGDTCYGRRVNETCTSSLNTCIDDNAECDGSVCDCVAGFIWNGSICVGHDLCDPCDPSVESCQDCLVCSPHTFRCECPTHQVQIGDACYGTRVTETCTHDPDTCTDDFAMCNGTVCDCITGFVWNGSRCVGHDLWDPCDPATPSCESHLVCSPHTYRCECPPHEAQLSDMCVGRFVTEVCSSIRDTCVDDNAECNGTICDCITGFTWNGSICVGMHLCEPCDPNADTCDWDLVCSSSTHRCECPTHQVQIGDHCIGTRIGEECTDRLDTCVDDNAMCNGSICVCIPNFVWNGSICVGHELCDPCDPWSSTCQYGLECSEHTYRCECPMDKVQIGDICYGTRVTETCLPHLDTCIDDYAECNGTICDCMAGFTWNGSECVGSELCDPCDPAVSSCSAHLVCNPHTYRCECPTDKVQIGNVCYGTLVTEQCTLVLDTCVDDYAECNGTICDCIAGFIWNGSRCLGPDIWDPCDPLIPTCRDHLECNHDTYRCGCPEDRVQVKDQCFGTRVTEPCTPRISTCVDDYATCKGTTCDCDWDFVWNGTACVGRDLCDPCDLSISTCRPHLVCGAHTYRCECPTNEVQYGNECYGTLVTETCTPHLDTCTDDYAECNGTICDCISEFIWNGSRCVGPNPCDPCDPSVPSCRPDLECSTLSYRCECPFGYVLIGDHCYGRRIGENCTSSLPTCIDDNAGCSGGICVCLSPFTYNSELELCVGPDLDDPCDDDSCGPGLKCGATSRRCECDKPPVQIDNMCYGTRIDDPCTDVEDTCIDDNAECSAGTCSCIADFTWNGLICVIFYTVCNAVDETSPRGPYTFPVTYLNITVKLLINTAETKIRIGKELDDPCDDSKDSCSANGLVCGPTDRCECPDGIVQVGNECVSLTCDPCSDHKDCLGDDQICEQGICQCDTGFFMDQCGVCRKKGENGDPCLADEQCISHICACDICVATEDEDCCNDCEEFKADIVVITDSSGDRDNFKKILGFANTFVNAYVVSPDVVRIGFVDFADYVIADDSFELNEKQNNLNITLCVLNNELDGGQRNTHLALDEAVTYFQSGANRAGVPDFTLLLTDGSTDSGDADLTNSVNALHGLPGMTVYAVGIKNKVPLSELKKIATDDDKAFRRADLKALNTIVEEILDNSCSEEEKR